MSNIPTFGNNSQEVQQRDSYFQPADLLGEMGFASAFPPAYQMKVVGNKYEINPLVSEDFEPWLAELTAELRKGRMEAIPKNCGPVDRWKITRNIEETELTPDHFMDYIFRPKWTKKVAEKILEKASVSESDIKVFFQKTPPKALEMFSAYFSGLFTIAQFNLMFQRVTAGATKQIPITFGGTNRPLAESPQSDSAADSKDNSTGRSLTIESDKQPEEALVS